MLLSLPLVRRPGETATDAVPAALVARANRLKEQCAALALKAEVLLERAATPGFALRTALTDLPEEATLAVLKCLPTGSLVVAGAVCAAWRAAAQHPSLWANPLLWEVVQVDCLTMGQAALRHLTRHLTYESARRGHNVKKLIIMGQLRATNRCQKAEEEYHKSGGRVPWCNRVTPACVRNAVDAIAPSIHKLFVTGGSPVLGLSHVRPIVAALLRNSGDLDKCCVLDIRHPGAVNSAELNNWMVDVYDCRHNWLFLDTLDIGPEADSVREDLTSVFWATSWTARANATPDEVAAADAIPSSDAVGVEGLAQVMKMCKVKKLTIRSCAQLGRAPDVSLALIINAACNDCELARLVLRGSALGPSSLHVLGRFLSSSTTLIALEIHNNGVALQTEEAQASPISDGGFCDGLRAAPVLSHLALRACGVAAAPSFVAAVASAVAGKLHVFRLDVGD